MFPGKRCATTVCWLLLLAMSGAGAESPAVLNYQGSISVNGKPFTGAGYFTFLIADLAGTVLWASGKLDDARPLPAGVLRLLVTNGVYSVKLGDAAAGMPPLDAAVLARSAEPKLRVRFNDGTNGWRQAGEDVSLVRLSGGSTSTASGISSSQAAVILREIRELRAMIARQQPPTGAARPRTGDGAPVAVTLGQGPALGRADAPLVLVEFTDYQCGYCKRFDEAVLPELITNYVNTGKLRIISRNLPLPFHTNAEPAAVAALCAGRQDKYWLMREKLFDHMTNLTVETFIKLAKGLGLDTNAFRTCMRDEQLISQVRKDSQDATAVGITGTPSFVLGKPFEGRAIGTVIEGAKPYPAFEIEISKVLNSFGK